MVGIQPQFKHIPPSSFFSITAPTWRHDIFNANDIVEEVVSEEIEIPERLRKIIDRKKQAILMENNY